MVLESLTGQGQPAGLDWPNGLSNSTTVPILATCLLLMNRLSFAELLSQHMRRIRASAADVAAEVGMSREAVNNWRNGDSLPGRKHRDRLLACAGYLRLTELETNALLAAAGFEPEYPSAASHQLGLAASAATTTARDEVLAVFQHLQELRPYPILMLLCPAHLGQPPEREAILAEAQRRFGSRRVLHLQPPFSLALDTEMYFSALAAHSGLEGVHSDLDFETALARLLRDPEPLFCLVSRFEQGPAAHRDALAGILRSLSEMHSGKLYLLICGGEALAALKFVGGDLSLLNIAQVARWPEPSRQTLQRDFNSGLLSDVASDQALALSGGHPLLLAEAIRFLRGNPRLSEADLAASLQTSDLLWTSFLPWLQQPSKRQRLSELLALDALGPARPWLHDADLRALFWSNLLTERVTAHGKVLVWRSALIQELGRRAVLESTGVAMAGEDGS